MKFVVALFCLLAAVRAQAEAVGHTQVPLSEIKKAVEEGKAVLVDVREQKEWDGGHVKGALFLPLSGLKGIAKAPENLPSDKPVYIHCAAGVRCVTAAGILKKFGLDVRPIKQSYAEIEQSGFATEK